MEGKIICIGKRNKDLQNIETGQSEVSCFTVHICMLRVCLCIDIFGLYNDALWTADLEWGRNIARGELVMIWKETLAAIMNITRSLNWIMGRLRGKDSDRGPPNVGLECYSCTNLPEYKNASGFYLAVYVLLWVLG
jgi:hypothetical protein